MSHTQWTNIWRFHTARFTFELCYTFEDYPDISWDDTGEIAEKLNSGEWGNFTFRVRVLLDSRTIAEDYLGNSIYADPAEFRDHIGLKAKARADGHNYGSYFTDMVRETIRGARKFLCNVPDLRC